MWCFWGITIASRMNRRDNIYIFIINLVDLFGFSTVYEIFMQFNNWKIFVSSGFTLIMKLKELKNIRRNVLLGMRKI